MSGSKRDQQAEQRRNQLIDTALELFSAHGFEATRISDIAQAAGVAQGLLYHYFPSKDTLLAAIIARHGPLPLLHDLLVTTADGPARETLLRLASGLYALIQEHRSFARLVVREIIWRPETREMGMAVRAQALEMLAVYLRSRVEAGDLRPHDSHVVGQTIASSVILISLAGLPFDPYISGAIDVILQGVAAPPSAGAASLERLPRGE
jgi:AcrR family transcriptional regulator